MNFKNLVYFFLTVFLLQTPILADVVNFNSLPEAVSSEEEEKEYSFNGTKTIEVDLGELKGCVIGSKPVKIVFNKLLDLIFQLYQNLHLLKCPKL